MSTKFLHMADWQVGKPFGSVSDDEKRHELQSFRLRANERLGKVARESGCQFIVVAGDLFDSTLPTRSTVSAFCAAVGDMKLPIYAIPGNHDHGGEGSVWMQPQTS